MWMLGAEGGGGGFEGRDMLDDSNSIIEFN
jgi:hypothetical protein